MEEIKNVNEVVTENEVEEAVAEVDTSEMSNDELKGAINDTLSKIRTQAMILGFRVSCQSILDKIANFEHTPGAKSNNDHKRLIKSLKQFAETGLARKMNENGEIEVPEDYTEEEKRPDILCYTTETLTEDLTITGDAYAQLYLSSDCEDTDLIVRITDVDENGRSMKLADGMLCVRYRNGFEVPEFMEAGVVYPVKIRTTKLSHTFKASHKLRITITSSAKNFTFPNSNTRAGFNSVETKVAKNSIHRGGAHASHVVIRVE